MRDSYRPIDLARVTGLSTQTIRNYERLGFMPPAGRSEAGFRQYTELHLRAILTARAMIEGYGWKNALRVMRQVHSGDLKHAIDLINGCHASLHASRIETEANLVTLRGLSAVKEVRGSTSRQPQRIREAAALAGVRASALRFWESNGLVSPHRDPESGYRLYDPGQVRLLRVVALLRKAGYGIDRIREIIDQLAKGDATQAVAMAEKRLSDLSLAAEKCVAATAAFWEYVKQPAEGDVNRVQ